MKPSLKLAALSLALVTTTMGLVAWSQKASTAAPNGAPVPSAKESPSPAALARVARRWREGESFVYEVQASRAIEASSAGDRKQVFSATLRGFLAMTVLGPRGDRRRLQGQLSSPRFEGASALSPGASERLGEPFQFEATAAGELGSFSFAPGTPPEVFGLLKSLVLSFQVVSPPGAPSSWQTTEQDTTGEYRASYDLLPSGIHKSKEAYTRARGVGGLVELPGEYAVRSSAHVDLGEHGWPTSLSEEELLDTRINQGSFRARSRTTATLLRVELRNDLPGKSDLASLIPEAQNEQEAFERARKSASQNLIAGRNYRGLAGELRSSQANQRNSATVAMSRLFQEDPSTIEEARDAILKEPLDSERVARTTAALGHAGTVQAQRALAAIVASPDADSTKATHALTALGLSKNQLPENEDTLLEAMKAKAKDTANAATLALGSSVRTRNEEKSGDTGSALQTLIDGLHEAQTAGEQRIFLLALGNTGDARALDAIEPFLANPDVELRIAATSAQRFMPGERAEKNIIAATTDVDFQVRQAAVETVPFRPVSMLLPVLAQLLKKEPQEAVRIAIIVALHSQSREAPEALDALRWAEQNDPSSKVRGTASKYLTQA